MKKMTFEQYDNRIARFESLPDPSHNYGLTEKDMLTIETAPDKYLDLSMYLLTRSFYTKGLCEGHVFDNSDAMKPQDVIFRLNEVLCDNLLLFDDETEVEA